MEGCYVYIMTNKARVLFTGVTLKLRRRVCKHKEKIIHGFPQRYDISCLVYFEKLDDLQSAMEREEQIEKMSQSQRFSLIEDSNPMWRDLSEFAFFD